MYSPRTSKKAASALCRAFFSTQAGSMTHTQSRVWKHSTSAKSCSVSRINPAEINLRRIACKPDTATLASQGLQIAELGEAEYDFHHVIAIDPMVFGNFVDCCKSFAVKGDKYQAAKAIVREVGEAHLALPVGSLLGESSLTEHIPFTPDALSSGTALKVGIRYGTRDMPWLPATAASTVIALNSRRAQCSPCIWASLPSWGAGFR